MYRQPSTQELIAQLAGNHQVQTSPYQAQSQPMMSAPQSRDQSGDYTNGLMSIGKHGYNAYNSLYGTPGSSLYAGDAGAGLGMYGGASGGELGAGLYAGDAGAGLGMYGGAEAAGAGAGALGAEAAGVAGGAAAAEGLADAGWLALLLL